MKTKLFLAVLAMAVVANAESGPLQCKVGFEEIARCSVLKVLAHPGSARSQAIAARSTAYYREILACKKNSTNAYVQINAVPESNKYASAELPAKVSSTGVTTTVRYNLDEKAASDLTFGGLAGGTGNGQLTVDVKESVYSFSSDRYTYAVQCDYKR